MYRGRIKLDIAVDFDGTCVYHDYPSVGNDIPGAVRVLNRLKAEGHRLFLWTRRGGKGLADAADWFVRKGIKLDGHQANVYQASYPKIGCDLFIDDAAVGAPLKSDGHQYDYIDWDAVELWLEQNNILTSKTQDNEQQ